MNICIRVYMHKNWYSYIISYHSTRILLLLQWPTIPIIIRNVSHKCKCTHATQTKSRFLSKYYHLNFQHLKFILIIICAPHRQSSTHMHTCGWYVAMSPRHAIFFFLYHFCFFCACSPILFASRWMCFLLKCMHIAASPKCLSCQHGRWLWLRWRWWPGNGTFAYDARDDHLLEHVWLHAYMAKYRCTMSMWACEHNLVFLSIAAA